MSTKQSKQYTNKYMYKSSMRYQWRRNIMMSYYKLSEVYVVTPQSRSGVRLYTNWKHDTDSENMIQNFSSDTPYFCYLIHEITLTVCIYMTMYYVRVFNKISVLFYIINSDISVTIQHLCYLNQELFVCVIIIKIVK